MIDEGFNKGNLDALDELFAPGYQEHQVGLPPSWDAIKESIRGLRSSFPDLVVSVEDLIADDDMVWGRSSARGTHLGLWMGLPATGKKFAIEIIDVCRFRSGKIVEHWGIPDKYTQMMQLGVEPAP